MPVYLPCDIRGPVSELSTDLYAAYYNRAIANERLGDITSAYWDYRKALDLQPEFEVAARQLERFTVETRAPDAGGSPV